LLLEQQASKDKKKRPNPKKKCAKSLRQPYRPAKPGSFKASGGSGGDSQPTAADDTTPCFFVKYHIVNHVLSGFCVRIAVCGFAEHVQ